MTIQKIYYLSRLGKEPLEINVPTTVKNILRWAVSEFVRNKADLCGVDLRDVDLRGAKLCGAKLCGADLRGADLRGANLRRADLRGADLHGVKLRGADLHRVDLRETNLCGADLHGVNLIPLPIANGYSGWVWRESDGSPPMISYGCHYGDRSLSLPEACTYWAGKENRREIYAALDYAEAIAKIKGWI